VEMCVERLEVLQPKEIYIGRTFVELPPITQAYAAPHDEGKPQQGPILKSKGNQGVLLQSRRYTVVDL